jgi:AcrR family transcriptional regulator
MTPRKYELKRRAEQQQRTRQTIVEATLELHGSVGPARTTISAIAKRAGVRRMTVYRHFPDERSLFEACTTHGFATYPPPDPTPWRKIADPEERLRRGLGELYAYYRLTGSMWVKFLRDAEEIEVLAELGVAPYLEYLDKVREVLAVGWGARGERRRRRLMAALGHALELGSWISLTQRQGLDDEQAVEFMVRMVGCVARD